MSIERASEDQAMLVYQLVLLRGNERYEFRYLPEYRKQLQETLGRFAADPELSFTWFDACIVCNMMQKVESWLEQREKEEN
ncbi:hypothetical protein A3D88_00290 [Candidatus Peribacteria bacterium RIFCSPHIGHO2_02_FULL_52_16]|nr:MAG: hypothetical protein A2706_01270 [Candidatus Peribacteria bacterium RIFCSPHIGHO2_01_FULL_51_35]OGJ61559.1 MAG: hypothetical protein A3D88_00290 [Candidatus Peribacteria bacterium RIFCSPHIGHO2_02_FULL_52_16]